MFSLLDFFRGGAWFRWVAALEVKHRSSSVNNMLEGFPGIVVGAIASPLDKVSKAVFFGPL